MGGFNRKAETGLVVILIIIIVLFFFGWLINVSQRECKTNKECGAEAYCGSDFSCHQYPNIQKTVVQYSLFWPAVILGLAIIIAAWIFRGGKFKIKEQKQASEQTTNNLKTPEEVSDISEPYYKSDSNVRTP